MIIDYNQLAQLIESNYEVRIQQETVSSSKLRNRSVLNSFVPEVSLYAIGESNKVNNTLKDPSAGLVASINVFNGLRDLEQAKINNFNYETSKLVAKKDYNEQIFLARKYYVEALKVMEDIKILAEHEKINKNNKELILKKVSSGLSPKSEELIFKKIDLELKEQRLREDSELKISLNNLKYVLGLDQKEKIELSGNLDIENYSYAPIAQKLDLAIIETNEAASLAEKKVSGLWRVPKINFYAEKSFTNNVNGEFLEKGDESKEIFGVKATMPLFSEKNTESIDDQIKKIEVQAAFLRKKAQVRKLEENVEAVEIEINHLKSMIEISKSKVDMSKEIMDKTFTEFRLGLKEALSLNEASAEYLEARKDLIEHQVAYILSVEKTKVDSL